jgi:ribosome maturation factor RimP
MREQVVELLNQALEENPSLFLIDLEITEDNQIRVTLDGDNGVKVEDCISVSRAVEHNLDREEIDFSIDVMSCGASEPLTMFRQYVKNIGRGVLVKTNKGEKIEATLTAANEEAITLNWKAREPKPVGKGKVTVQKVAVIPYNEIVETKVMIKFN